MCRVGERQAGRQRGKGRPAERERQAAGAQTSALAVTSTHAGTLGSTGRSRRWGRSPVGRGAENRKRAGRARCRSVGEIPESQKTIKYIKNKVIAE